MKHGARRTFGILSLALAPLAGSGASSVSPRNARPIQDERPKQGGPDGRELAELLSAERRDADRARRRGDVAVASRTLTELLDEEPSDAESRVLRSACHLQEGDLQAALEDARRALADAAGAAGELRAACARQLAEILLAQGEAAEAVEALRPASVLGGEALAPLSDARDAWALGRALWEAGRRKDALEVLRQGAEGEQGASWERLLARARCERRLGFLERASRSLVDADAQAEAGEGREPDVLVELGQVYFEADGEIDHPESRARSPRVLFDAALDAHPFHEGALLGLYRLHRFNWNRQSRPAHEILTELFLHHPRSIEGLLAGCSADLDDGQLVSARERLDTLRELCPKRREVRTLEGALAWIEHRREDTQAILASLAAEDAADARPERELGRHLCELYRFAESLPFLRAATERDPLDAEAWTELGRGLANTGAEEEGSRALEKAIELAALRQNAWRHNTALVLSRMRSAFVNESSEGDLSFAWAPEAAEVLRTYLVPFYQAARAELAERYGHTPGPVHIEVFGRHKDFSVRSTGFEGFPALGVCFGPVVTAVSPLSELRGHFSWARTSFHEFTHVIHLGLSHNRCPRWITEGLATWEEERANPAWTRNMRRELIDALANGELIGVRELNRAFRGPRILFGYYQGGLLCRMLIEERGFQPMIRLLEAFDRGLDLDQALREVYAKSPEELDREFEGFVRREVSELAIEPRWSPLSLARAKLAALAPPPADDSGDSGDSGRPGEPARAAWAENLCTLAWGYWQNGQRVDAEQALRRLDQAGSEPARSLFLRGEMALARSDRGAARALLERALGAGGEDFRARMALGHLALQEEDLELAERQFLAAEKAFPGHDERDFSAELALAALYERLARTEEMQRARERWLAYNSDEYPLRLEVARWHVAEGRAEEAARMFAEANQIDPFRRVLHVEWGRALALARRWEEAAREFQVALAVPPELDQDAPGPLTDEQRAELYGLRAQALAESGRRDEALELARKALELDPDATLANELLRP